MDEANEFVRLRYDEEAGVIEALLLTCQLGNHYYPGSQPLRLPIKGRDEAWALAEQLFELTYENHGGLAVVIHRGARYVMTHTLWRPLLGRLCDHLENVELGIPERARIVAEPLT